jgi:hypothetical protein
MLERSASIASFGRAGVGKSVRQQDIRHGTGVVIFKHQVLRVDFFRQRSIAPLHRQLVERQAGFLKIPGQPLWRLHADLAQILR